MHFIPIELSRALAAFADQQPERVLLILSDIWQQWDAEGMERGDFDDALYNALCDSVEMTDFLVQRLPVIELNDYLRDTLQRLRSCLAEFEQPGEADWAALCALMPVFQQLLIGLAAGTHYLKQLGLSLTNFPPKISVELTSDGYLCLYRWDKSFSDADMQRLQSDFASFFKTTASWTKTEAWQAIEQALAQAHWAEALALLERMETLFAEERGRIFKTRGDIFVQRQDFYQAADCYLKSRLFGQAASAIQPALLLAGNQLLAQCSDPEERERLKTWLEGL